MSKRLPILFVVLAVIAAFAGAGANAAPAPQGDYIVVLKDSVADPGAVAAQHAKAFGGQVGHVYRHALKGYAATLSPDRLELLRANPLVAYVADDMSVSIASKPIPSTQTLPTGIDRADGDLSSARSGDGKGSVDADIAVLDTGIDADHPDLNVVGGINCAEGKSFDDVQGHGTHVAGTAAAIDNGFGVVGVAPGARLWAVRVLNDKGSGNQSKLLCGIDWVTSTRTDSDRNNDIEVANLSLSASGADDGNCGLSNKDAVHLAICNSVAAGVTYVVAAGNSSRDASLTVPAAYDEVLTVSALTDFDGESGGSGIPSPDCMTHLGDYITLFADDAFAFFANFGPDVDLIAPGVCILSTLPPDTKGGDPSGYGLISGTSQAAPHVAGAAALWIAAHPGASPAQVKAALIAAGRLDWNNSDDPDGIKEPLVNVGGF